MRSEKGEREGRERACGAGRSEESLKQEGRGWKGLRKQRELRAEPSISWGRALPP